MSPEHTPLSLSMRDSIHDTITAAAQTLHVTHQKGCKDGIVSLKFIKSRMSLILTAVCPECGICEITDISGVEHARHSRA